MRRCCVRAIADSCDEYGCLYLNVKWLNIIRILIADLWRNVNGVENLKTVVRRFRRRATRQNKTKGRKS